MSPVSSTGVFPIFSNFFRDLFVSYFQGPSHSGAFE